MVSQVRFLVERVDKPPRYLDGNDNTTSITHPQCFFTLTGLSGFLIRHARAEQSMKMGDPAFSRLPSLARLWRTRDDQII